MQVEGLPDGAELHRRLCEVAPLPRSLTGDGVRQSLDLIGKWAPLTVHEVPSGTRAFDWTVPDEWNLRRATLMGPDGAVVADSDVTPLAVVGYSVPTRVTLSLADLQPHLHSVPESPDLTPYRTSYYSRSWGFCLSDRVRRALPEGQYEVFIDADLGPGHLTYGEVVVPGRSSDTALISAHTCHPAMANDNASGLVVASALAATIASRPRNLTWRIVFAPGTIGPLVWLSRNADVVQQLRAGIVLAGVGDPGDISVKATQRGDTLIDRALAVALRDADVPHRTVPFTPWGYDERQYASPGFDLPVALFMRTPHGTYPEYHTDADDEAFVTPGAMQESLTVLASLVEVLENNGVGTNQQPHGEPQLGRRGLYPTTGGRSARDAQLAMLWVLNQSDGTRDLIDVAHRSGLAFSAIVNAAAALADTDLFTMSTTASRRS